LLPATTRAAVGRVPTTLYVIAAAWAAIALVRIATSTWERKLPVDTEGDLMSRGTRTRLTMLRRVATVLVTCVAGGVVLLQFDVVRTIGLSLLASAGIASVLVGFAAQRTLGGIIAGIELSITQPLRIGDVVVFRPDELGKVEHIYFTYVVVRLWDDRRLIVPVTRVMSEPFENWTRTGGGELMAPVELWVDLAAPVEELRRAFRELCEKSSLWDRRRSTVQVVSVSDRAMLVRGVASVDDASRAFDLRCELREGWIAFLGQLDGGRHYAAGRVKSVDAPEVESTETPHTDSAEPKPSARPPLVSSSQASSSQTSPSNVSSSASRDAPKAG
jgi:hypothetical protein